MSETFVKDNKTGFSVVIDEIDMNRGYFKIVDGNFNEHQLPYEGNLGDTVKFVPPGQEEPEAPQIIVPDKRIVRPK
jgi:hypothetical protein